MLSALREWSGPLLVWGRGAVYREGTRDRRWQDRRLLEWELTDLSQTRSGMCAVSHDRNMCFLVKAWRRYRVHWEGAGSHILPRWAGIRKETGVLEKDSRCVIILVLGRNSRVLAVISHFLSISCSGIIPIITPSLRQCNEKKDQA